MMIIHTYVDSINGLRERERERGREKAREILVENANINICHKVKHQNAMQ